MPPSLSPPDYDRLRVLGYTVEINAPPYRAIMAVFAATKARFKLQLRSDDLRRELEGQGLTIPENGLEPALDQLVEWGNLVRAHDTRRVATLSDFYRRHYVYRITPAGEAAEGAIGAVVAAMHRSGSLQKVVMLGTIARRLASVVAELRKSAPDPSTLYEALLRSPVLALRQWCLDESLVLTWSHCAAQRISYTQRSPWLGPRPDDLHTVSVDCDADSAADMGVVGAAVRIARKRPGSRWLPSRDRQGVVRRRYSWMARAALRMRMD